MSSSLSRKQYSNRLSPLHYSRVNQMYPSKIFMDLNQPAIQKRHFQALNFSSIPLQNSEVYVNPKKKLQDVGSTILQSYQSKGYELKKFPKQIRTNDQSTILQDLSKQQDDHYQNDIKYQEYKRDQDKKLMEKFHQYLSTKDLQTNLQNRVEAKQLPYSPIQKNQKAQDFQDYQSSYTNVILNRQLINPQYKTEENNATLQGNNIFQKNEIQNREVYSRSSSSKIKQNLQKSQSKQNSPIQNGIETKLINIDGSSNQNNSSNRNSQSQKKQPWFKEMNYKQRYQLNDSFKVNQSFNSELGGRNTDQNLLSEQQNDAYRQIQSRLQVENRSQKNIFQDQIEKAYYPLNNLKLKNGNLQFRINPTVLSYQGVLNY